MVGEGAGDVQPFPALVNLRDREELELTTTNAERTGASKQQGICTVSVWLE